ncbi:hypothetical protein [Methylotenera sp.]|uniref:hypothetical protein n=1 Tax=Methylotenera sp. TaxID=2051956 RepID=UPI00272D9748|nr:hypothetical protein [Methylotenera sp.]
MIGFRGIKPSSRTDEDLFHDQSSASGRPLTDTLIYSWSAVMQSGDTQTLKRLADTTLNNL